MGVVRHPGRVLLEDFMRPLGLSVREVADAVGVDRSRIYALTHEERSITADTAVRLGRAFGVRPTVWLELQAAWDIAQAEGEVEAGEVHSLDTRGFIVGPKGAWRMSTSRRGRTEPEVLTIPPELSEAVRRAAAIIREAMPARETRGEWVTYESGTRGLVQREKEEGA